MERWSERNHVVKGLDPVADAFSGTVYSDVVRMGSKVTFEIIKGVGATGTSTVTVEACDDFVPTTVSAVPFKYRRCANTADAQGALTAATSAGFATTAGSSERYIIEVLPEDMGNTGYPNLRLKMVEVVDSPVLGGIEIFIDPVFPQAIQPTQIA